jgi:hypothetical protein
MRLKRPLFAIDRLSGWRGTLFATLVVVLTVLLGWSALQVRVEQSNASMNARNDQQAAAYQDFKESFGSDEILLLSVTRPDLLDTAGLTWIATPGSPVCSSLLIGAPPESPSRARTAR